MKNRTSRRTLLKELAMATLLLPSAKSAWGQQKLKKNPFELGVASGSATHDSVVLWTRLIDQGFFGSNLPEEIIPVQWELADDESFTRIVKSGVSPAMPSLAHSVHVEIGDLPANRWFHYRFRVGEYSSSVGRTRTFGPTDGVNAPIKVAFASCQNYEQGYFNAYTHLVAEKPDLMLFLGDYIYEYPPGDSAVRTVEGSWCLGLSDYRRRYAFYKKEKDLQAAHACCPWLVIWDDHEVQNDYAGSQEGSSGPSVDFKKRRAAAYQAYYEHMPLRASTLIEGLEGLERGAEMRIYEHYGVGSLIGVSLLDARQYRSPQVCTPGGKSGSGLLDPKSCNDLRDDKRTMLGASQEQWLERQFLSAKQYTWNFIAQSTLFGPCPFETNDGVKIWNDGWDGYPASRSRILDQVVRHEVPNLVVLGGDVHSNWVGYIKEDYDLSNSKTLGVEFCGTSICSRGGRSLNSRQKLNPHFIFSDGFWNGYAIAEVTVAELKVHLRIVKDHRQKESGIETLASFSVKAGSNQIYRV